MRGNAQVVYSNLNWSTGILGITPEYFPARDWEVIEGRMLTQEEVDGASKVALVGQTVARNLFGDEDPLGQVIRIKKVPFTIIGVLDRKGQTTWGQDQDDQILIPITTAKTKVLGGNQAKGRAVGAITIKVIEADLMKAAENEIRELLRQRHRLQPHQDGRLLDPQPGRGAPVARRPPPACSPCCSRPSRRSRCWWAASGS